MNGDEQTSDQPAPVTRATPVTRVSKKPPFNYQATMDRIVEMVRRQFTFADEMFADGLISLGGANHLKGMAVTWAGGGVGMESWSSKNIRTPRGRKIAANDGWEIEHAVPKSVVVKMIDATGLDPVRIQHIIETYTVAYYIPKEEHARINRMGLRSKMPDGWDGIDPLARYRAAGLDLTDYDHTPWRVAVSEPAEPQVTPPLTSHDGELEPDALA